ncbi:hypothetical protein ABEF95_012739 [Exophiala dermatitidis]
MVSGSSKKFILLAGILLVVGYVTFVQDDRVGQLPHFGYGMGRLIPSKPQPSASDLSHAIPPTRRPQLSPIDGQPKAFRPTRPTTPSSPQKGTKQSPVEQRPSSSRPEQGFRPGLLDSEQLGTVHSPFGGDSGTPSPPLPDVPADAESPKPPSSYREMFSLSHYKGTYFEIEFPGYRIFNPNILPHPSKLDTWIVVAQKERGGDEFEAVELACEAVFDDQKETLICTTTPSPLPVKSTTGGLCKGEFEWFNGVAGPHDARVFYGPKVPYIIYGSRSGYTCFGQWIQDFRKLTGPDKYASSAVSSSSNLFAVGTELRRPGSFGEFEKNWFVFWDEQGQMYAHFDLAPHRSFARLDFDGSIVGDDLGPATASTDGSCVTKYLAPDASEQAVDKGSGGTGKTSLHQATNSLLVTLCNRLDPTCKANEENTFIMAVVQQKFYYAYHNVYRPYVVLFRQTAPFALYAISQKPLWFHGHRKVAKHERRATGQTHSAGTAEELRNEPGPTRAESQELPENQAEMFFVTSMSWKNHGQTYHGYLDDVIFLTFGIEDNRAGAIDVRARDLVQDMGLCGEGKH